MKTIPVGIIQQQNTADISDNRRRIAEKVRVLAEKGAKLIVNQELHDSLYFCQTEHVELCSLATPIPGDITDFYSALAAECGVVLVTSLFEPRRRTLPQHRRSIRSRRLDSRQIPQDAHSRRPRILRKVLFHTRRPWLQAYRHFGGTSWSTGMLGPMVPRSSPPHGPCRAPTFSSILQL